MSSAIRGDVSPKEKSARITANPKNPGANEIMYFDASLFSTSPN